MTEHDKQLTEAARRISKLSKEVEGAKRRAAAAEQARDNAEARADYLDIIKGSADAHRISPKNLTGESAAILVLSDWHYEENIDPAKVGGRNEYNPTIASKRIRGIFQKTAALVDVSRGLTKIDELIIAPIGDMITGYIHEELVEGNWLSPTEACLAVQDELVSGIDFLIREIKPKRVVVPTAIGNHGRCTQKMRIGTAAENSFEWLMYRNLAWHYRRHNPKVQWIVGNGYHNVIEVKGRKVRLHHGDAIRYQGGVGGITVPVNKALAAWNQSERVDLDIFGHWHQSLEHRSWVSNGSLIGYGPYSVFIKAEFEEPSQSLVVMSRQRGKIMNLKVYAE
jgi:hypothetical protein